MWFVCLHWTDPVKNSFVRKGRPPLCWCLFGASNKDDADLNWNLMLNVLSSSGFGLDVLIESSRYGVSFNYFVQMSDIYRVSLHRDIGSLQPFQVVDEPSINTPSYFIVSGFIKRNSHSTRIAYNSESDLAGLWVKTDPWWDDNTLYRWTLGFTIQSGRLQPLIIKAKVTITHYNITNICKLLHNMNLLEPP